MYRIGGECEVLICETCGMGLTVPLVDESELGSLYPTGYAPFAYPRWPWNVVDKLYYRRELSRPPFSLLLTRRSGRLLDVGGGRGDLGVALAPHGWSTTVLDPSEEACRAAESQRLEAVVGTLADPPRQLGSGFDCVVFHHALEHVADPLSSLQAAYKLLNKGGLIIVVLPNFGCWERKLFGASWWPLELPRHRTHMSDSSLTRLLRKTGFDDVMVSTTVSPFIGLPESIEYRFLGRRIDHPAWSIMRIALRLLTLPASALVSRLHGEGNTLLASATKLRVE